MCSTLWRGWTCMGEACEWGIALMQWHFLRAVGWQQKVRTAHSGVCRGCRCRGGDKHVAWR